jgi:hypothetical protein
MVETNMKIISLISSLIFFSLTSCNVVSSYSLGTLFIKYLPAGNCPEIAITNYGRDDIGFLTGSETSVTVKANSSSPLSPIVGSDKINGSYDITGGTVKNGGPYSYDIGLKCSSTSPEIRQIYGVYSTVTLTEDSTNPSGLSVSVVAPIGY